MVNRGVISYEPVILIRIKPHTCVHVHYTIMYIDNPSYHCIVLCVCVGVVLLILLFSLFVDECVFGLETS